MKSYEVLGVRISAVNLSSACEALEVFIQKQVHGYVCVAPVSSVVESLNDGEYREILNNASMVTPDGMPIAWLGRYMRGKSVARTYGPDLMLQFCALSEESGYRHYFYGGSKESLSALLNRLKTRFPLLKIAGAYAPEMLQKGELASKEVIREINDANADVLWIGLGSPKQDIWMKNHQALLNVPVMVGAGAAFDFIGGAKKQAPRWMQRIGLEWFFRLCCEPKRLWKRYMIGNSIFCYLILKDIFKGKIRRTYEH